MTFDNAYFNLGYLDTISYRDTFVHRLDSRVKLIVSFIFVVTVVSMPKYEISSLIPFFIYPFFLIVMGDIPFRVIAKKVLFISPLAIFVGIFNPLIDTNEWGIIYGISVTYGFLSFLSIIIKFILTTSTLLLLIASTSFPGICYSLERLKMPQIFVIQLLFMYRYLFVLLEESLRMIRARESRSFGKRGRDIKTFIRLISVLLIRTLERAERIYYAMLSRGFRGEIKVNRRLKLKASDIVFASAFISLFLIFRHYDIVNSIGLLVFKII